MMMRAVSDLTKPYGVPTVASLNSIMVDATGMCGACMVPVLDEGKTKRHHACIDGPEFDAQSIDWDKFMPRFDSSRRRRSTAASFTASPDARWRLRYGDVRRGHYAGRH